MDNKAKDNIKKIIERDYSNIAGIVVSQNDRIIYEKYFDAYKACDTIHIASVTKSIMSILIGIAIDKGYIESINQCVLDFFPDYKLKRGEKTLQKITIRDLLTMTAPYKYKSEPYTKVYSQKDWVVSVLDLLGGRSEIGDFKYTTIGINVLSGILGSATGVSVKEFATKYLFNPLEIVPPQNKVIDYREAFMGFIKDKYVEGWVIDFKGVNTSGWGLALKTQDLMKIGQLYLNKGQWNDEQIVSEKWVKESTMKHSKWGDLKYGYLWWIMDDEIKEYAAIGDGGNIIYINSSKNLVVAITSRFKPRVADRLDLIKKEILPYV